MGFPLIGILSASGAGGLPIVTGGTVTTDATYTYHTFTASSTLTIEGGSLEASYLLVGGGGNGVQNEGNGGGGGGGGASQEATTTFDPNSYTITIGSNATDSSFDTIVTAVKGSNGNAFIGGSGGSPGGGNGGNGGNGFTNGSSGGAGAEATINATRYGGGGGGGSEFASGGSGGAGGGGRGGGNGDAVAGGVNTGGGGGGGSGDYDDLRPPKPGGSGIFIFRYVTGTAEAA